MAASFKDLECFINNITQKLGVSGIDCIVYRDHTEIFRHSGGYSDIENRLPMSKNALYNIYSGSKIITCTAAMQLIQRGKLLLTDPLYEYLPEFQDMKVKYGTFVIEPAKKPIRIIDLFTMTAGFSYEMDTPEMSKLIAESCGDYSTSDFVRALAKEPLLFEPGEGWNYSFCHDVLGSVIEVVSGMSFGKYLKQNIFEPLGMKDTGFSLPEEKKPRIAPQYEYNLETHTTVRISSDCILTAGPRFESGGAGLISSVDDYILFADALACGGVGINGERIIAENTINLMGRNQLQGKGLADYKKMVITDGVGYGLGVSVITDAGATLRLVHEGVFGWGGIGGVQVRIDPVKKLSYFVAQHTIGSPKALIEPYMLNILYSSI